MENFKTCLKQTRNVVYAVKACTLHTCSAVNGRLISHHSAVTIYSVIMFVPFDCEYICEFCLFIRI